MKGKITNFKAEKGFGFILGEDNQKYFFHISTVENPMDIEENYMVEFKTQDSKKGLNAIHIVVQTPLFNGKSKDKILKIKNLRMRASDIKEYVIEKTVGGELMANNTRFCYTLTITTYTSSTKYLIFESLDENLNETEAYKWLDYIDNELEKLI